MERSLSLYDGKTRTHVLYIPKTNYTCTHYATVSALTEVYSDDERVNGLISHSSEAQLTCIRSIQSSVESRGSTAHHLMPLPVKESFVGGGDAPLSIKPFAGKVAISA